MPKPSRHLLFTSLSSARREMLQRGVDPATVSLACLMARHADCKANGGRVTLSRESEEGYRYATCGCPDCQHPPLNTRRTHTTPRSRHHGPDQAQQESPDRPEA